MKHKIFATPILAALLLIQSCGASDFASQLRLILAASGPLISSLNLGDKRAAVVQDFTDLASGAATLADDLKTCGTSKPCKITAIERFEVRFWDVERRGHFKLSPKLENIQSIMQGVIEAAKIYYGKPTQGIAAPANPAKDLQDRLDTLKRAMRQ